MDSPRKLILFTLADRSGMGRFAAELATAAGRSDSRAIFIAPVMEHEPLGVDRIILPSLSPAKGRVAKLLSLVRYNFASSMVVWKNSGRDTAFAMIDLYSTVPLSILPVLVARLKGAKTLLNLHDFYPHAFRYPSRLIWLEKFFFRFAYRQFDQIAALKDAQVRRLEDEAGVPSSRILRIEHGAFPLEGIRTPSEFDIFRVLILGSLRSNKMIEESIAAVESIHSRGKKIRLRVAGAPRREELAYWSKCLISIKKSNADLEVIDRFIEESEMPIVLSGVDAILCPYQGFDSQSGVAIVAVSNGIPLVATRSAVISDFADSSGWTEIKAPADAKSIADAIERLMSQDREDRFAAAAVLRKDFEKNSHWAEAIERIRGAIC